MSILEFRFKDRFRPWELRTVVFKPALNLLVGVSGVGKTRLLQSLKAVCAAGVGAEHSLYQCEWEIQVKIGEEIYTWSAETGEDRAQETVAIGRYEEGTGEDEEVLEVSGRRQITFIREHLVNTSGTLEVRRAAGKIEFDGKELPKLKDSESVLSLLRQEPRIQPVFHALSRVDESSARRIRHAFYERNARERARRRYAEASLEELQEESTLPFLLKASLLQETRPEDFARLVAEVYREIFPAVCEVRVGLRSEFLSEREREYEFSAPFDLFDVALREDGVEGWITSGRMSSGMRRTLLHVLELALSPRGTVLLIDEYENSMGVNCLPAVTDHILDRAGELQFVITSHHPYVISNVAKEHWMVVRRQGSVVEVVPASEIPSLQTRSSQDAFVQLMNAEEYRGSCG